MTPYFLDCETRSEVDISTAGAHNYAKHPSTDLLCIAYAKHGETPKLWYPGLPVKPLNDMLRAAEGYFFPPGIWARNAAFDRLIMHHNKHGIMVVADDVWFDTATLAAGNGYPRSLGDHAKALGIPQQKDSRGLGLIKKLSCPPFAGTQEDLELMYEYCLQDVVTDMACYDAMQPLPAVTWRNYHISESINDRGIMLDRGLVEAAASLRDRELLSIEAYIQERTRLKSGSVKMKDWVLSRQPELRSFMLKDQGKLSLDQEVREHILDNPDTIPAVLEVIQAIEEIRGSSTAKFAAMKGRLGADDRVRGVYVFNGAVSTGRFSSMGLQMHNLPRQVSDNVEADRAEVLQGRGLNKLKGLLRPSVIAGEGFKLVVGDLSQIEARALPWLSKSAGGEAKLDAFRAGKDIYTYTAAEMSAATGQTFTRQEGKVADLLLGFLGGEAAIRRGAKKGGLSMTIDQAQYQVDAWRAANKWCVDFGNACLDAVMDAIQHPRKEYEVGHLVFSYDKETLYNLLPSGRSIMYPKCFLEDTYNGQQVTCLHGSSKPMAGKPWPRRTLWRGLIIQNATQAFCADILKHMLRQAEKHSTYLTPVGHTHDEMICEVREEYEAEAVAELKGIMTSQIEFAPGLPLATKIICDKRYIKA